MKAKISILLILLSLSQCITPVIASEAESNKENVLSGASLDAVFEDMKQALRDGKEVSFEASLEKVGGLSVSMEPQYDLSDTSIDFNNLSASLTNLGFSQLSANLAGSFNNIDLSGNATGCTKLFENSFGSISEITQLERPSFPEEFNADSMLKESQSIIDKAYSSATNSESFKSTKEIISIGAIFDAASSAKDNAPSSYELKNISDMQAQLSFQLTAIQNEYSKKYEDQINHLQQKDENNETGIDGDPYASENEHTWSDGLPHNYTIDDVVKRYDQSLKKTFIISEKYAKRLQSVYPKEYASDPYNADRLHLIEMAERIGYSTQYLSDALAEFQGKPENIVINLATGEEIHYAPEGSAEDIFLTSKNDAKLYDSCFNPSSNPLINSYDPFQYAGAQIGLYIGQVLTDAWNFFVP